MRFGREGVDEHGVLEDVFASYAGAGVVVGCCLDHELVKILDDVLDLCWKACC